jgi:hypothetical protein
MDAALVLLYLVAAGVNYGWQPTENADGGYEYIIQVEPELLDMLASGESVPIESNVPPEVAPIRKVRVVVGRGVLPREIVQSTNRTAYFARQAAGIPDRYDPVVPVAATTGERYPPPSLPSGLNVGPPPSVLDRTQTAVRETGNTLRDGVEAGIRAANGQLDRGGEQVLDATREAGEEFGQQLQNWASDPGGELQATGENVRSATERTLGAVGSRLQATNPFVTTAAPPTTGTRPRGGVVPPPWPASSTAAAPAWQNEPMVSPAAPVDQATPIGRVATRTANGWTSIGATVAAPPLIVPKLDTITRRDAPRPLQTSHAAQDGPLFPDAPLPGRGTIHSPLTDPGQQADASQQAAAPAGADDWATDWGTAASSPKVSINRGGSMPSTMTDAGRNSGLVSVQPVAPSQQNEQQPSGRFADLWDNASTWEQSAPSAPAVAAASDANSTAPTNQELQTWPANDLSSANAGVNTVPTSGVQPNSRQSASTAQGEQERWLPLLVVSLSLMGSLSANLFLGWSYMDARQKYRTLVRKTADKFRLAVAA